ncbi:MAG TPA: DUF1963 domain-containing protein [Tepidisphaeraceae bacterium]|jgi:hypothetical protein|nr:DUF1963 domain-containing protein [Tepidisphaeraceae bacterium]
MPSEKRTTPPPRYDIANVFPKMKKLARTTVRLHPRRGNVADLHATKLGGKIAWPAKTPWPHCHEHDQPFIAALQISKADVPEFPFKTGTDLFQLLWCPSDENEEAPHLLELHWRESSADGPVLKKMPALEGERDSYPFLLDPCQLFPERVVEYPGFDELDESLQAEINAWDLSADPLVQANRADGRFPFTPGEELYRYELSLASGTKIGGWPDWVQYPAWPTCDAGHAMEHLLTVASMETFGEARWCPIEDRAKGAACKGDYKKLLTLNHQIGLDFGDGGNLSIFICRKCKTWPWKTDMQCG